MNPRDEGVVVLTGWRVDKLPWRSSLATLVVLVACVSRLTAGQEDGPWDAVSCPRPCLCVLRQYKEYSDHEALRTVDCQRQKLRHVPSALPNDTGALILKDNAITTLDSASLDNLSQLVLLDLSYNALEDLDPSVFHNMTLLHILDLAGNHLTHLRAGVFSALTSLEELTLSLNRITTVDRQTFWGLENLRTLALSHNDLNVIDAELFLNLTSLEQLYVNNNKVRLVQDQTFSTLSALSRLSLSHNNLSSLGSRSLHGLSGLTQLDLSDNQLTAVPVFALNVFQRLKLVSLDRNPLRVLAGGSFYKVKIGEICLRDMPGLVSVDAQSVSGMSQLHTLRIHSNKQLVFVHPHAFQNLPQLEDLYLHDNALMALSPDIVLSLPSLRAISLYDNPFKCDCNAYWLQSALSNRTFYVANSTLMTSSGTSSPAEHVTFRRPASCICDSPSDMKGRVVGEVALGGLTTSCGPTVLALFAKSYQKELGKSVSLACRGIGVPFPHVHWILSNGKVVNNTSNYSRIRLGRTGTLYVGHLKAQDAGTYTCVATNEVGYDRKSTVLRVHSKNIQIVSRGATNNFITVTWNGTESTIATSDYMILYHKQDDSTPEKDHKRVHLRPYMRKYVISGLEPDTPYELCIAYEDSAQLVKLNCVTVRTKSQLYMVRGMQAISKLTIILALCLTSLGVVLICILSVIIRRYHRRKAYQDPCGGPGDMTVAGPKGAGMRGHRFGPPKAASYNVGQLSNIPLDNLYNPPTTPLCTSTTSLVST